MYADDHQLLVKEESAKGVAQKLNERGKKISTWYKDNFLRGNYDKYKAMLLRRTRKTGENTLTLREKPEDPVQSLNSWELH